MSRARRRTPAELDALLEGGTSGDPQLDAVLSAASGPARPHELATPAPAVGAEPVPGAPPRSRRVLTRLGTATLLTKAVTGAVGAAAIGAAAVAGATHHLPGQHRHHAPVVSPGSTADSSSGSGSRSAAPSSGASSGVSSGSPGASASASGSPSASGAADLPTLCRAWLALPPGSAAARHEPRFTVLIQAAGGVPAVTAYCRDLPASSTRATPSSSGPASGPASGSSGTGRPPSPSPLTTSTRRSATPSRSPSRTA